MHLYFENDVLEKKLPLSKSPQAPKSIILHRNCRLCQFSLNLWLASGYYRSSFRLGNLGGSFGRLPQLFLLSRQIKVLVGRHDNRHLLAWVHKVQDVLVSFLSFDAVFLEAIQAKCLDWPTETIQLGVDPG